MLNAGELGELGGVSVDCNGDVGAIIPFTQYQVYATIKLRDRAAQEVFPLRLNRLYAAWRCVTMH